MGEHTTPLTPFAARARAVGNAVYLEHVGSSGDIAAWGCEPNDRAEFVADQINRLLNGLRAEIAAATREGADSGPRAS